MPNPDCEERCLFCNALILRVRKYFTNYDICPARLEQKQGGILCGEKDKQMREKRRILHQATDLWLDEMLNSATSNRESGQRRTIPTRRKRTRVARSEIPQTNCRLQPWIDHIPSPVNTNTTQPGKYLSPSYIALLSHMTDATNLNGSSRLDSVNLDAMIANQTFPSNDVNDFSRGMDLNCAMTLPSFDLSTIDHHGPQLRPSISVSYTIDEPYFNLDYPSIESGADGLVNEDSHKGDSASDQPPANHTSTGQRFVN